MIDCICQSMEDNMKKRVLCAVFAAFMALILTACGSGSDTPAQASGSQAIQQEAPQPPDLTGEWKQVNSESDDSYQAATITGDTIVINWVSTDSKALYWAGSFTAPTTDEEPYTWDSNNDHEQTDTAIMASSDDTKTFTYEDGQISYDVSMMGVTKTVRLEKE